VLFHSEAPMKNLDSIVDKIEKRIDDKDKIREQALRLSRDIIIQCRKAIQRIHQNEIKDVQKHLKAASAKLAELYDVTQPHPELYHAGFVENAAQEFVEAQCLIHIMQDKDLPDPDSLQTTYSSYLLGLCDVVGELRRKALDEILAGRPNDANRFLKLMETIYDAIMRFDYPSALVPIKRKQDMVRNLIERTRGELAVASCEQRLESRAEEVRGILDSLQDTRKSSREKQQRKDLDIDKVW
jgi:translin